MLWLAVSLLALAASSCHGAIVGGRLTYINYNSKCGIWNDPTTQSGLILEECCPVDISWPGAEWQQLSLSYVQGSVVSHFGGNTVSGGCSGTGGYTTLSEKVLDDGTGLVGIEHVFQMGLLTVTKTETWDFHGKIVRIRFKVKYTKESYLGNCKPISKLRVMHAVDPDQDRIPFGTFNTFNDVIYNGPSGLFAEATGPQSCKTFGYGICANALPDGSKDEVGFTFWQTNTPASLTDPNGANTDQQVHYQHTEARDLHCGDEREFGFFAVWGRCNDEARKNFLHAHSKFCEKCFKLPRIEDTRIPRCRGRCPCDGLKANCSCTYTCKPGPVWTPVDVASDIHEKEALVAKCDGSEDVGKRSAESVPNENVKAFVPEEVSCAAARTELSEAKRRRRR